MADFMMLSYGWEEWPQPSFLFCGISNGAVTGSDRTEGKINKKCARDKYFMDKFAVAKNLTRLE